MCGIAGFSGQDRQRMECMVRALQHRGPDGHAVEEAPGATLGHARLAILDPRPEGNQPMWNDDRTVAIVFNGEIFNYRELKERHRLTCRTGTDTEVLLKLYELHGTRFVKDVIGMFAFGLYDTRTRTWHVARDPSGIKPLYVAYPAGKLHFASEMRSLMTALPMKPDLNLTALSQYLRLQYVPGPHTLCQGIESLPPGTFLSWREGIETRSTFQTNVDPPHYRSRREFREHFPELMDRVVHDHLVSDKPVGVFLSGGMDSSIVLHHMCRHAEKPVRTFTVRFEATEAEGAVRFNTDADLARRTAEHYGTEHRELLLTAQMYRDAYRDTARALDQPNADSVSVAQFLLSQLAKPHVDVILTGAGGDELFGGYPRYRVSRILETLRHIPAGGRRFAARLLGQPQDVLALDPGPTLAERLLARPVSELHPVIRGDWFNPVATTTLFQQRFNALTDMEPTRAFMEFDRHLWLVDESLRLADATTMGSGVEGRVPFLDPRIIGSSLLTPADWHVTWRTTKTLLKDTYRPILPAHLFTLKKASFYPPLAKWFRREASTLVEETLEHPRIRDLFQVDHLRSLYERHRNGEYHLHTLSSITQLRYWLETVYDT